MVSIFCCWLTWFSSVRCCGGLERIDDRRLAVALLFLDRSDEEGGKALASAGKGGIDRRDLALPVRGLANGAFERSAIALGHHRENRALVEPSFLKRGVEQPREQRIRIARCVPCPVHSRDRHRRVLKEAHEAHFRGALGVAAVIARAIEHERARSPRSAVGAKGDLVEEPRRQRAAAAGLEINIEDLGLHVPGRRRRAW